MIKLYTDAGLNTNLNLGVVSYVIKRNNKIYQDALHQDNQDNHYLEFLALKIALQKIIENHWNDEIVLIHSDSQIVIDSLDKNYSKNYQPILDDILSELENFPEYFAKHIADKDNRAAHTLVHQEMLKIRTHSDK
ncbi:reverse transcriptase-like protein [Companilactobacillus halodurans]|uniref:Reverse transcriptase-like protein n=1 Tax=Companilactobacillus halodurans TaxID=2584183 RepID=A0A5P0ZQ58_9LACO|nr:reverse transcriptase-like protein [Companilactobacillus halodurans]MQS76390.1 reverse transcriptase-like protein [Companilactobacillus halodurans]MQS96792.1 reverse transcriptase-like protein [Companilactobacillus halodurans]